jgi:hypothetical protein
MIVLAAPYSVQSGLIRGCHEWLAPACFAGAVASGLTPAGRPVPLVRGHKQRGRRDWVIADTACCLRLWESRQGLMCEAPGDLPRGFSGVSVRLHPIRFRRIGPQVFELLEAGLYHIALLCGERPAYPSTYFSSLRLNGGN